MDDLKEIGRMAPMSTLRKNTLIQTPETFRKGLYFMKKGKLRLYKINSEGKQFTLAILGSGNVLVDDLNYSVGRKSATAKNIFSIN